jgi:hypothetical protein
VRLQGRGLDTRVSSVEVKQSNSLARPRRVVAQARAAERALQGFVVRRLLRVGCGGAAAGRERGPSEGVGGGARERHVRGDKTFGRFVGGDDGRGEVHERGGAQEGWVGDV